MSITDKQKILICCLKYEIILAEILPLNDNLRQFTIDVFNEIDTTPEMLQFVTDIANSDPINESYAAVLQSSSTMSLNQIYAFCLLI